jgi:putative SbcD/Mre11-related phosphoesterase
VHGVQLRERAAYLTDPDVLVVADLHVGRDEESSVQFPLGERSDLLERLDGLLGHFSPATVVAAGDVLHSFEGASDHVAATLDKLELFCKAHAAEFHLLEGNHDKHLTDIWDKPVQSGYRTGDFYVCHGHELPAPADRREGDRYVVGHEHPAVTVEGVRHPCYLTGPGWGGYELLMLPAFNRLAPGVEVNGMTTSDFDSPFVTDADALRPLVYDEDSQEVLSFPPLGEFREML